MTQRQNTSTHKSGNFHWQCPRQGQRREVKVFFPDVGPVRRVGGANWASFSGMWWVVVLTNWVGGGAGLDADLAAEATPVERGIQLSTHSGGFWEGK